MTLLDRRGFLMSAAAALAAPAIVRIDSLMRLPPKPRLVTRVGLMLTPGDWDVYEETAQGVIIGRMSFMQSTLVPYGTMVMRRTR